MSKQEKHGDLLLPPKSADWLMLRASTESISTSSYFWANVISGFIILMIAKAAFLVFTVSGAEGQTPIVKTSAKILLCLGWDVVGALLFAALLTLLVWPVKRFLAKMWPVTLLTWTLYGGYTLFLLVSIMTQKGVGTPFDKAAIDLAFLNTEANPDLAGVANEDAIWVSIRPYLSVPSFALMGSMWLTPILCNAIFLRWVENAKNWKKRIILSLATIFALLTIVLLPNLRNGEVMGIRVHTFGLERSHFISLVSSYLKPLARAALMSEVKIEDPYCFDVGSITDPGRIEPNPLLAGKLDGVVPKRSNLVMVVLESVSEIYRHVETNPMPLLTDRISRPGAVSLTAHYSNWPQTFKALFALLCSELPYPDYRPITYINPGIPCVSLTEALKNNGYATGHFNSADLAYDRQLRFYRHRKFDVIHGMYDMPGSEGRWKNNWGVDEAVTIEAMFDWVEKLKKRDPDQPFAAMYAMAVGHHPYVYPGASTPDTVTEQEYRAYLDCLGYIDKVIESVFEGLKAKGLDNDTLVLIVSDHGEGFLQHPLSKSHGPMVYEEAVHVPAVLVGPQLMDVKDEVRFATSHVDLAPTLLGLLDVPVPATMKGRDLTRESQAQTIIFSGRPPASQVGLRDGKWKYLWLQESGSEELFDLEADPGELHDLMEQHPELAAKFKKRLMGWQAHSRNLIEDYSSILQSSGRRCGQEKDAQ